MPYYQAGGYAYAAGGGRNYAAGGFSLKGLVKGVGNVLGTVAKTGLALATGGPIAAAQQVIHSIAPTPTALSPIPQLPMFPALPMGQVPTPKQRAAGVEAIGVSPLGTVGVKMRKHRHMNAGNAKAARRAVRRIKSVRHLLTSIERELPRRPAVRHHGSPGVITRGEARRALNA